MRVAEGASKKRAKGRCQRFQGVTALTRRFVSPSWEFWGHFGTKFPSFRTTFLSDSRSLAIIPIRGNAPFRPVGMARLLLFALRSKNRANAPSSLQGPCHVPSPLDIAHFPCGTVFAEGCKKCANVTPYPGDHLLRSGAVLG